MKTYSAAQSQYFSRPADERFSSLADLYAAAARDRETCRRSIVQAADMRAVNDAGRLMLTGKTGTAAPLTHWSTGQLATIAGAPAGYMRSLPPQLAADCLNHGLDKLRANSNRDTHALLLRNGGPESNPYTVRAITSEQYSRVWDAPIVRHLQDLQDRDSSWVLPMTWSNVREGAYRGDRDMFVFLTNGGSIVEDPTLRNRFDKGADSPAMYRGIIIRNSEVGAACLSVETFLFRYVCGNHMIWGIEARERTKRRHVGLDSSDAETMINRALRLAQSSPREEELTIAKLNATYYAKTKDEIVTRARKDGLTKEEAEGAFDKAEANEANPFSVWGFVNGITRQSQTYNHADDRYTLDQLAGRILTRERIAVSA